ncbi:MAG: TrkH family potassium uptake protein, partial [Pseudomonadota bacterium]
RELARLIYPSLVTDPGARSARIKNRGTYIAWVVFMLYALSIAVTTMALSLTGLELEEALILAIASLSTCGPLLPIASEGVMSYAALPDAAKAIAMAAMVLGRLETLALIAMLNAEFWRR